MIVTGGGFVYIPDEHYGLNIYRQSMVLDLHGFDYWTAQLAILKGTHNSTNMFIHI